MNYYNHHLGDYDGATAHLSWDEDQAYTRLLRVYYRLEKPIPADLRAACRLVRASSKAQKQAVERVLGEFFVQADDGWHNKRCDEEIAIYRSKSEKARGAAAISAAVRRGDRASPRAMVEEQWAALVTSCGSKCVRCGAAGPLERDHIVPTYQGGADELENWQPLCRRCNASKGPDRTDHRPLNWRSAFAQHSLAIRCANQPPITNNQEPTRKTDAVDAVIPAAPANGNAVEYIPLNDGSQFAVSSAYAQELARLYPKVDVPQTLREIRGHNLALDVSDRKAPENIKRHIDSWMRREMNGTAKA